MKKVKAKNLDFKVSSYLNDNTFLDYCYRMKKIACSMFVWDNIPSSMDSDFIEEVLFYDGQASILYDENYGYINLRCSPSDGLNIYNEPTKLHCFSNMFSKDRLVYHGFKYDNKTDMCIHIKNNVDSLPTSQTIELFALRLYNADRTIDTNINAQKMPIIFLTDDKTRLTIENFISQYDGNKPYIITNKNFSIDTNIKALDNKVPYVADKLTDYKKEIWNEFLTFLGINNLMVDKKERLVSDEANSNNELINLNLMSFYNTRLKACNEFNEYFKTKGTDKEIKVKLNSDLHNLIKSQESVIINKREDVSNE